MLTVLLPTAREVNRPLGRLFSLGALSFVQAITFPVLTPHPGPLPVEGRGSRDASSEMGQRRAAFVTILPRSAWRSERGGYIRHDIDVRRAPSPLKGERAGVRGEAVRLTGPAPENEKRPFQPQLFHRQEFGDTLAAH